MTATPGCRIYPREDQPLASQLYPGDYACASDGVWYYRPPWPYEGIGDLRGHAVIEHEDGTISVAPSIKIAMPPLGEWHGWLERGVWRET